MAVEPAGRLRRSTGDGDRRERAAGSQTSGDSQGRPGGSRLPGRAMAGRPWGAPSRTLKGNCSALLNASQQASGGSGDARPRPSWLASTLAFILIFTIVVDILGNVLVILSVYRNKKLRNAGRGSRGRAAPNFHPISAFLLSGHLSRTQHPQLSIGFS